MRYEGSDGTKEIHSSIGVSLGIGDNNSSTTEGVTPSVDLRDGLQLNELFGLDHGPVRTVRTVSIGEAS